MSEVEICDECGEPKPPVGEMCGKCCEPFALAERARIVAWLRMARDHGHTGLTDLIDSVERGEHEEVLKW